METPGGEPHPERDMMIEVEVDEGTDPLQFNAEPVGGDFDSNRYELATDIGTDPPGTTVYDSGKVTRDQSDKVIPLNELQISTVDLYGPSLWSLAYYSQYFNVDSSEVKHRILLGVYPPAGSLLDAISTNPDLYGPFWIVTTAALALGLLGNVALFVDRPQPVWEYDFNLLTLAAIVLYCYITVVPLGIWAFFYFYANIDINMIELVCLFGYAATVYLPMAVLCMIPSQAVRWTVILVAVGMASWLIGSNLRTWLQKLPRKVLYGLCAVLGAVQLGLALVVKMQFFR